MIHSYPLSRPTSNLPLISSNRDRPPLIVTVSIDYTNLSSNCNALPAVIVLPAVLYQIYGWNFQELSFQTVGIIIIQMQKLQ